MSSHLHRSGIGRGLIAAVVPTVLILLLVAPPATGQTQTDSGVSEVFVDTVDVNVINLEVVVTDREGEPIHGLTREDFRLLEDGEEVEITNFYAVEGARRVLPPDESPSREPERVELPEDQRLHLAVALDSSNLKPANRNRVIDQIKGELARVVRPGDRVMVTVLDPLPFVEQAFTDDMEAVNAALDRIARSKAGGLSELEVLRRQIERDIGSNQFFGSTQGPGAQPEQKEQPVDIARRAYRAIQSYANQQMFHMRRTFAGLEAMISSLSGLPGRKAVLFVSEEITTRPGEALLDALFANFQQEVQDDLRLVSPASEARRWDLSEELQDLSRTAGGSQVTFYTLFAAGTPTGGSDVETGVGAMPAASFTVDLSGQDTLLQLADATGGDTMLNAAAVDKLLNRMSSDFSEYYSLGFVSPDSRDGRYHRLKVEVVGLEDARVRHSEGYQGTTVEQEMLDRTVSALVLDTGDNPLGVRIELGEEQPEKKNQYVLPVLVKVPISKLVLVPQRQAHRGKIAIYVAVRGDDGGMSRPQRFEVPVEIPNEQLLNAMSREVGYGVNLLVRGGESKLAVAVRDEVSATHSTVNLNIDVGEG